MTQEEKELLKDLCARLPYGIKVVNLEGWVFTVKGVDGNFPLVDKYTRFGNTYHTVGYGWKPYLRPMSSMTDEERQEYNKFNDFGSANLRRYEYEDFILYIPSFERVDWLNSHHFDYRGLIEKGLALKASDDMYK